MNEYKLIIISCILYTFTKAYSTYNQLIHSLTIPWWLCHVLHILFDSYYIGQLLQFFSGIMNSLFHRNFIEIKI